MNGTRPGGCETSSDHWGYWSRPDANAPAGREPRSSPSGCTAGWVALCRLRIRSRLGVRQQQYNLRDREFAGPLVRVNADLIERVADPDRDLDLLAQGQQPVEETSRSRRSPFDELLVLPAVSPGHLEPGILPHGVPCRIFDPNPCDIGRLFEVKGEIRLGPGSPTRSPFHSTLCESTGSRARRTSRSRGSGGKLRYSPICASLKYLQAILELVLRPAYGIPIFTYNFWYGDPGSNVTART